MSNTSPVSRDEINLILWKATDYFRGILDLSEYKNYILVVLFLRYISEIRKLLNNFNGKKSDAINKIFQSGNFLNIPEGTDFFSIHKQCDEPNFSEIIDDALLQIENNNEMLVGVFHPFEFNSQTKFGPIKKHNDLFKNLFSVISDPILNINADNLDNIRIFSEAFDFILKRSSRESRKSGGEHCTPENIVNLMVSLLDPEAGKTIYDPTVGSAGMLVQSTKWVRDRYGPDANINCYGQDINMEAVAISMMNLIIHHIWDAKIYHGDTLSDPKTIDEGELQRFDYAISNPPLALQISSKYGSIFKDDPFSRFEFGKPGRRSEFAFIQHVIASLNDKGKAVIIVPAGFLFASGSDGEIRKKLIEEDLIEAVISLGPSLLASTSIPINLLIINMEKQDSRKKKILFINASEEYQKTDSYKNIINEIQQNRIVHCYKVPDSEDKLCTLVDFKKISENDFNLVPARYVDLVDVDNFLGGKVRWIKLSDIAEIHTGIYIKKEDQEGGTIPWIRISDLDDPSLSVDDLRTVTTPKEGRGIFHTKSGDLLLSKVGFPPKMSLIYEDLEGVIVDKNLFIIRFKTDYSHLRQYILEFLKSDKGQALLSRYFIGATIPGLRLSDLNKIRIPIPERSVIQLLSDLHQTEREFLIQVEKARDLRKQLFYIEDPEIVKDRLNELSNEAQILSTSIIQADSLDYQVRNFYPFLIAFSYRTSSAIHESTQRYIEQLRVAENLLVFLATVGFSLLPLEKRNEHNLDIINLIHTFKKALGGGVSPGHWWDIARSAADLLRNDQDFAISNAICSLWFKGGGTNATDFSKQAKELVELKNDQKHDRGPKTTYEYEQAAEYIQEIIDNCYKELSFFVRYPIRLIKDIDHDYQSGDAILDTLVYTGDHQGLRREQCVYPNTPFTKDVLYIEIDNNKWIPLYPFISVFYCPSCKTRETYFIDRWDGPGKKIILKSFERGHIHEGDKDAMKVSSFLEHWFEEFDIEDH